MVPTPKPWIVRLMVSMTMTNPGGRPKIGRENAKNTIDTATMAMPMIRYGLRPFLSMARPTSGRAMAAISAPSENMMPFSMPLAPNSPA